MNNPIIKFCFNWNLKLMCKNWSTIRLKNPEKYKLNQAYDIELDGNHYGDCVCVFIKHFKFNELPEALLRLDLGYDKETSLKLLKHLYEDKVSDFENAEFSYMLFEWRPKCMDIKLQNIEPVINQVVAAY